MLYSFYFLLWQTCIIPFVRITRRPIANCKIDECNIFKDNIETNIAVFVVICLAIMIN